ncbi:MAG: aminoacyl-tRNA hydrolase [Eubacterium sp.]|nr:aminoacyl-tRNA hydrolase [Eubacterium sp.]
MKVIVGLGNPGRQYENTRHNIGFIAIDRISEKLGIEVNRSRFRSTVGEGRIGTEKVILAKPETYMNDSGLAVHDIMDFYKLEPEDLIVVYDDFDIPEGSVRIRPFGSAGTHNGMRSIVRLLGSDRFPRVRIGTGKTDMEQRELIGFVLGGFSKDEVKIMEEAVDLARDACICWAESGIDLAMNRYNTKKKSQVSDPPLNASPGSDR